jgi:flavin reductase (DIM6/NTAB) family NADH-FMN oxidoreductase RutF
MKELQWNERSAEALELLSKGAFLTTAHDGKVNTMTIGWGSVGFVWRKPVFTVMVRPSRHTYNLIENSDEFTVSIPLQNMQKALALCGTKSGRDLNKFEAAGITTAPGQKVAVPIIDCAGIHYECKILYKQAMIPGNADAGVKASCYADGDYHVMYYGEIVAVYTK